jgi:hypothetical protein
VDRLLVGMCDYGSGLDLASFSVVADFEIDGVAAGEELASRFKEKSQGVWEWKLTKPMAKRAGGKVRVAVKDKQGNVSRIERTFSVEK